MDFKQNDIIQKVKNGDASAFKMLVVKYQQAAFSFAFKMMGDEDDARDVVQESFINIWQKINTYDIKRSFKSWLYKIIYNKSIDALRAKKRRTGGALENIIDELVDKASQRPDIRLENNEAAMLIRMMTEELPEKQKLIFTLRDLQGLSVEETTEISGMSEEVIKSNLYHARKSIRLQLTAKMNYQMKENE